MELQTEQLRLVLETTDEILARIAAMSLADQAEVSPSWLARLRDSRAAAPWTHGFRVTGCGSGVTVSSTMFHTRAEVEGEIIDVTLDDPKDWL